MFILLLFLLLMTNGVMSINVMAQDDIVLSSHHSLYMLDGDSVNIKMRLVGIDTPEMKQTCQKMANKTIDCGQLSKKHLKHLLKNTAGLLRVNIIDFDIYHRALVLIKKGKTDIAKQMVLDGFAYSYDHYSKEQQFAQQNKHGFWGFSQPPTKPSVWRKTHKKRW